MVVDRRLGVTMVPRKKPVSLAVHYGLLTAADKPLVAAKELEKQGDDVLVRQLWDTRERPIGLSASPGHSTIGDL